MKIYCVRHGHAESNPNAEGQRSLTQQGRDEVTKVANYLSHRGFHVSHVLHSEHQRAIQTAQILAMKIAGETEPETSPLLGPECSILPLIEQLQDWDDDTMVVGHMPFISFLVSALVVGDENYNLVRFMPATVVCLERYESQRWIINWIVRPDLVHDKFA